MGAAVLQTMERIPAERLSEQLAVSTGVFGESRAFVADYLAMRRIGTLEMVTVTELLRYRDYVDSCVMKPKRKKYFRNLLEQVVFAYWISKNDKLEQDASVLISGRAVRNKALGFLFLCGGHTFDDITYDLKCTYREYLGKTIATSKIPEYVKAFDVLKLEAIRLANAENPFRIAQWNYAPRRMYLSYHPNYEIAQSFYFVRDKEELVFDFSLSAPGLMEQQVFSFLRTVVNENRNQHDLRGRYLIPLGLFYRYCVDTGIADIEQMTLAQEQGFRNRIDGTVGTLTDLYMQVVFNLRRYLFLTAKETNWNANTWFMERFAFPDSRMNPAREIQKLTFGQIANEKNRAIMKTYMRYRLGVSSRYSLLTIRAQYYDVLQFLEFLDGKGTVATGVTENEIEAFMASLEERGLQPEGYNRYAIALSKFYGFLMTERLVPRMPACFPYYLKKTFPRHNDRTVPEAYQKEVLCCLKDMPVHLRLMYLNLWCIGLRVNEVCVIRGDAYSFDGQDAWIKIYQSKMKQEKVVPIPTRLYELMTRYIEENHIAADEYVFQSAHGKAYDAGTFAKQFKKALREAGMEKYDFRSHDFRHTVATRLYDGGASIEVIRDYLGHRESDMTKQYLDYMPKRVDAANETYFRSRPAALAVGTEG